MRRCGFLVAAAVLLAAFAFAGASDAVAQAAKNEGGASLPSAFQGFSRDSNEPVKIESNSLEVHDRERYAVFIGNVVVRQGDSTMRARELKVYYEPPGSGQQAKTASAGGDNPSERIRRLEAIGGVIITSKDQRATGDLGVFDMATNTATISGNVVVSQGPNVMNGEKLIVDLKTGRSRLEGKGRVSGLFVPRTVKDKEGRATPIPPKR